MPDAILPTVLDEHGTTIMPRERNEPEAIVAPTSLSL